MQISTNEFGQHPHQRESNSTINPKRDKSALSVLKKRTCCQKKKRAQILIVSTKQR